jgi:hypothetical protein
LPAGLRLDRLTLFCSPSVSCGIFLVARFVSQKVQSVGSESGSS